jgi:hypothetical protein
VRYYNNSKMDGILGERSDYRKKLAVRRFKPAFLGIKNCRKARDARRGVMSLTGFATIVRLGREPLRGPCRRSVRIAYVP